LKVIEHTFLKKIDYIICELLIEQNLVKVKLKSFMFIMSKIKLKDLFTIFKNQITKILQDFLLGQNEIILLQQ
jgi:hypothetical protein